MLCTYRRTGVKTKLSLKERVIKFFAKDYKPISKTDVGKFHTHTTKEALLVIGKWNRLGKMPNKINIRWEYIFLNMEKSIGDKNTSMWDEDHIPYMTLGNC